MRCETVGQTIAFGEVGFSQVTAEIQLVDGNLIQM